MPRERRIPNLSPATCAGSQSNSEAAAPDQTLIEELEKEIPQVRSSMMTAVCNVNSISPLDTDL